MDRVVHNLDTSSLTPEMLADMQRRDQEQQTLAAQLHQQGHTCVAIMESYPCQVVWCQRDPCTGTQR